MKIVNPLFMHPLKASLKTGNLLPPIYWSINHRCYSDVKYNFEFQQAFSQSYKYSY